MSRLDPLLFNIIFKNLSPSEIGKIDKFIQEIDFPAQHKIIQQGDRGDGLYVIIDGAASVDVQLFGDMQAHIADLSSNDIIGEVTLIEKKCASATVVTKIPTKCFFLSTDYFRMLQLGFPEIEHQISVAIISIICERIRRAINQVAGVLDDIPEIRQEKKQKLIKIPIKPKPITPTLIAQYISLIETLAVFKIFTQKELDILIKHLNYVEMPKHSIICDEGDYLNSFYLVIFGAVQAIAYRHNKIAKLRIAGPNNLVGQVAFFDQQPSAVSYYARENVYLIEISRNNLQKLHKNHAAIYYKFMHILFASFGELLSIADKQLLRLQAQYILSSQPRRN